MSRFASEIQMRTYIGNFTPQLHFVKCGEESTSHEFLFDIQNDRMHLIDEALVPQIESVDMQRFINNGASAPVMIMAGYMGILELMGV